MRSSRPILIAEDNSEDVFFMKRALKSAGINVPIDFVADGQEAVTYLENHFTDSARVPQLILLDVKMPLMNGFDVLQWVRKKPGLRQLPIIMLTSSDDKADVNRAYDLGANSYLVKPVALDQLEGLIEKIRDYWLAANCSPDCKPF
jgi:CheY-like chemotaxis protein